MKIFLNKSQQSSTTVIRFNPLVKWLALVLAITTIVLSYFGRLLEAQISFTCFALWLALFLVATSKVRQNIKSKTRLGKVKVKGNDWSWSNSTTYIIDE